MASYKEKARQALLDQVQGKGICDERNVVFAATVNSLPNGAYGMVLLTLKGNELYLSDIDMRNNVGQTLCVVPMQDVHDYHIGRSLFGNNLRFTWNGHLFIFSNMIGLKPMLEIIGSEAGK